MSPRLKDLGALIKLPFSLASLAVVITGNSSISISIKTRAFFAIASEVATINAMGCPQK